MIKHLPLLLLLFVLVVLLFIDSAEAKKDKTTNGVLTTTTKKPKKNNKDKNTNGVSTTTTKKPKNNKKDKNIIVVLTTTTEKPKKNKKDKTTPLPDTTTVTADSSSSDGLTTTGKIIVGVLCAVIALLIIGMIVLFCYLKKASKVGSSVAGNSGNTSVTNAGNNYTYNSPRPVGKPGPVLFDPSALAYNPPVYNKFIPPVQDPNDLSGGYRGYRPEYPPPYSATVPYGGAFSRLITR